MNRPKLRKRDCSVRKTKQGATHDEYEHTKPQRKVMRNKLRKARLKMKRTMRLKKFEARQEAAA